MCVGRSRFSGDFGPNIAFIGVRGYIQPYWVGIFQRILHHLATSIRSSEHVKAWWGIADVGGRMAAQGWAEDTSR
jgi:hypothetical protein